MSAVGESRRSDRYYGDTQMLLKAQKYNFVAFNVQDNNYGNHKKCKLAKVNDVSMLAVPILCD